MRAVVLILAVIAALSTAMTAPARADVIVNDTEAGEILLTQDVPASHVQADGLLRQAFAVADAYWATIGLTGAPVDLYVANVPDREGTGEYNGPLVWIDRTYRDNAWTRYNDRKAPLAARVNALELLCGLAVHERGHNYGLEHNPDPASVMYRDASHANPAACTAWARHMLAGTIQRLAVRKAARHRKATAKHRRARGTFDVSGQAAAPRMSRSITGVVDDNIFRLTPQGRAALELANFKRGRLLLSMGTPANDLSLRLWMLEADRQHWHITIAPRRIKSQRVPTRRAYTDWLRGILAAYPGIDAIEATNEPELTGLNARQAVTFYRAALTIAQGRTVLAGGFSDHNDPGYRNYRARYWRVMRATGPPPRVFALHVYLAITTGRMQDARAIIREAPARDTWITETGAFVEHGDTRWTPAQQAAQVSRVRALSRYAGVRFTYWTGFESCHGCNPGPMPAPEYRLPPLVELEAPYVETDPGAIKWDTYVCQAVNDLTTCRAPMLRAFAPTPVPRRRSRICFTGQKNVKRSHTLTCRARYNPAHRQGQENTHDPSPHIGDTG